MIEIALSDRKKYGHFFSACEDSCIITAVEGCGGELWVDDIQNPECVLIIVGSFSFLAGNPDSKSAEEMVSFIDSRFTEGFNIRCVAAGFEEVVKKIYSGRYSVYSRFATKRSFEHMDFKALEDKVNSLPKEYRLVPLDNKLYEFCKKTDWASNFVASFESPEDWEKKGLGFMILSGEQPVAGASSYSSFPGGIEVEIITRSDYRGKGFARITGAALLTECKRRGILASWDAAHEQSLRLAMKLGFEFLYKYDCYYIDEKAQ